MTDTLAFLNEIHPDGLPEGAWLLLFFLPGETSHWCRSLDQAAEKAASMAETHDVYFQVALGKTKGTQKQRIKSAETLGIPGVWADLDFGSEGHKKGNLPKDEDEAMLILDECPHEPTLIVHSGHGLQAYWLFKDFWRFKDDSERQEAQRYLQGWNDQLREIAREHGWDMDATHDLARVLRLPGTFNRKSEPARRVIVL